MEYNTMTVPYPKISPVKENDVLPSCQVVSILRRQEREKALRRKERRREIIKPFVVGFVSVVVLYCAVHFLQG